MVKALFLQEIFGRDKSIFVFVLRVSVYLYFCFVTNTSFLSTHSLPVTTYVATLRKLSNLG
jgi:hypothetical protein